MITLLYKIPGPKERTSFLPSSDLRKCAVVKSMTLDALEVHSMVEKLKGASSLPSVVRRLGSNKGITQTEDSDKNFLPGLCKVATSIGLAALRSGIFAGVCTHSLTLHPSALNCMLLITTIHLHLNLDWNFCLKFMGCLHATLSAIH